jgi:hypothetical protein
MPTLPNGNTNYRDTWYPLAPPWLRTGNGERYMYTLELCRDLLLEKANQAIKFRLPGQGDPSQLPYLAYDRQLVQGPHETNAQFVARLRNAFALWRKAGSRLGVAAALQSYLIGFSAGVAGTLPEFALVSGSWSSVTSWAVQFNGDALGAAPFLSSVRPGNWNWDTKNIPWRAWLVLYMSQVTVASGTGAATTTAAAGSEYVTGGTAYNHQYGSNVSGVWTPNAIGTAVNHPWITVTGLSGNPSVGQWLTMYGSSHAGNNGTFPIVQVLSSSSVVIANPSGVGSDAGPLTWSVGQYPSIAPGPVWGQSGYVFGQGQSSTPPISTGSNIRGVWSPGSNVGTDPTISWGLNVSSQIIQSIRALLQQWKSAGTYYESIIISFDVGAYASGSAYSPNSTPGSGNPDGTFGGRGKNVNGVWSPTRQVYSTYDAHCQGTGTWNACSVPNVS